MVFFYLYAKQGCLSYQVDFNQLQAINKTELILSRTPVLTLARLNIQKCSQRMQVSNQKVIGLKKESTSLWYDFKASL